MKIEAANRLRVPANADHNKALAFTKSLDLEPLVKPPVMDSKYTFTVSVAPVRDIRAPVENITKKLSVHPAASIYDGYPIYTWMLARNRRVTLSRNRIRTYVMLTDFSL